MRLGGAAPPQDRTLSLPSKATFGRVLCAVDPLAVEAALLAWQRDYWGVEAGLHQRLDISADEDRSRVRQRNAVWVLGMFRRIVVSPFMHWRGHNPKRAKATLSDFHEEMGLEHQRRAFALVCSKKSSALNDCGICKTPNKTEIAMIKLRPAPFLFDPVSLNQPTFMGCLWQ